MQSTEPEIWKPVVGYEGLYEVSDRGRVRGIDRIDSAGRRWRGRILRPKSRHGVVPYQMVNLWRDGAGHMTYVHRAVLEAFTGPAPTPDAQACHNDGDAMNNAVSNLRWGDANANAWDRVEHGTHWQSAKTHCKYGHPLEGANLMMRRDGYRKCRACNRERSNALHGKRPFDPVRADERFRDICG